MNASEDWRNSVCIRMPCTKHVAYGVPTNWDAMFVASGKPLPFDRQDWYPYLQIVKDLMLAGY